MAAAAPSRLMRRCRHAGAALLLICCLMMLALWAGSSIPRNRGWREATIADYVIGLETNGVHTALVLPLVTPTKDWRENFPSPQLRSRDTQYTHISISWGEREVFLSTPTWQDLSPATVLRILMHGGEGLAHVAYYVRPSTSKNLRPIGLSSKEYEKLVRSIEASLALSRTARTYEGYGPEDLFYETGGRYTAFNTCNQWTSDRLAQAGIRTGWWTPVSGGVMKWTDPPLDAGRGELTAARP